MQRKRAILFGARLGIWNGFLPALQIDMIQAHSTFLSPAAPDMTQINLFPSVRLSYAEAVLNPYARGGLLLCSLLLFDGVPAILCFFFSRGRPAPISLLQFYRGAGNPSPSATGPPHSGGFHTKLRPPKLCWGPGLVCDWSTVRCAARWRVECSPATSRSSSCVPVFTRVLRAHRDFFCRYATNYKD